MNIAIYGRQFNQDALPYVQEVFDNLAHHGVEVYVHHQLNEFITDKIRTPTYHVLKEVDNVKDHIDVFITLGGDGTMLDMVNVIRDTGIPVIGINFGRLGFLATINKNDIAAAIFAVANGQYSLDSRELMCIDSDTNVFGKDNFALNDITIHKRDDAAMITTHVFLNNEFFECLLG